MQISEDRKKRVIDLYFNQHKSYSEIAQIEKMSPRDISAIINEEEGRRLQHKQQEISAQAYQLFSEGKTPVEVAIILKLPASKVSKLYREYWYLKGLHQLNLIYKETNGKIWIFLKLYKELIKERLALCLLFFCQLQTHYLHRRNLRCQILCQEDHTISNVRSTFVC